MKSQQINTNSKRIRRYFQYYFILSMMCAATLVSAAPGQAATSLSSLCNVLAPSSFTVPDRIRGEEVGFRESILSHDKTTLPAMFKINAFDNGDFSFISYTTILPTFPIIQPSTLNTSVGETTNTSITAETRYVIGGGNSTNEVCVYKYQLFQVAGQFIRTGLSAVHIK